MKLLIIIVSSINIITTLSNNDFGTHKRGNNKKINHFESNEESTTTTTTTTIYSSCNEITDDGLYYIKPMADKPVLPVICSNGYSMLDASLDKNLKIYPSFLTSWDYGRLNTYYILSRLDDLVTFRDWFIPADDNTKFNIALGCNECIPGDFGDNTVYYIDSHTYCFSGSMINGCIDDINSASYHPESCNTCDVGVWPENNPQEWTKCMALHMDSDHIVQHDHISCVAHGLTFHPTLSLIRDACTCYQPMEINGVIQYQISIDDLPLVTTTQHEITRYGLSVADNIQFDPLYDDNQDQDEEQEEEQLDVRDSNIVYLSQQDFLYGTYRIKESGTYILTEDIIFNFNSPSDEEMESDSFSPNSIDVDELYWYPTHDQSAHNGPYPGLYQYAGAFTLGFFAGITVETDYVTIDLNGFTLEQDYKFYFQQRFFSLIELASQPFVPGQGPANWGAGNDVYASNVIIKNGNLGLSSHHSIHGNNNNFITITNINTKNFDVAGIQCNSCTNVILSDCVIGPQNENIPLLGRYTHSRAYLPRLKQLMDLYGDEEITFYNRPTMTVSSLIDRLINQMDMMYFHFINGVEYDDENDLEWIAAKKLLYNENGWMDGGSSYGVLFGGGGAQVVGIGARTDGTNNITISNVEIYGIYNQVIEKVKFTADSGATRLIFFDAMDWMATEDQVYDIPTSNYIGDAYSDITFAISKVVDSWYFQNSLYVSPEMSSHVFEGDHQGFVSIFKQPNPLTDKGQQMISGCGTDIQLHSSKGSIGLRIDGTQNINVDNVYIHDIYNWADLGSQTWCGPYDGPDVGNEDIDIQYGYTGTRSHGIVIDYAKGIFNNIKIENIESYNGEANGMTIYKQCDVILQNIIVDSIHAGSHLTQDQVDLLKSPNLRPRACGVDIRPDTLVTINPDIGIIAGDNIIGFDTCYDDDDDDDAADEGNLFVLLSLNNMSKLLLMTILSLSILLYIYRIIMDRIWYNQNGDYVKNSLETISEHTPLL